MFSRKEPDEEENALSELLVVQAEMQRILTPLPTNVRQFAEDLELTRTGLAQDLEAQKEWLKKAFSKTFQDLEDRLQQRHEEVTGSLQNLLRQQDEQQDAVTDQLKVLLNQQGAMAGRLKALEAHNQALSAQLEEHRDDWQSAQDYELRDENAAALGEWCDHVRAELAEFDSCKGMAGLFAQRLHKHMNSLRGLLGKLGNAPDGLEAQLEDLQRVVFAPDLGVFWNDLTPANSTAAQRRQLHLLENATAELRAHVREELRRATGIAMTEIVPGETRFDARLHESSEFLEVPTSDEARHNLIVAVERPGYQKFAPDGSFVLLQTARVRRAVLSQPAHNAPEVAAETVAHSAPEADADAASAAEVGAEPDAERASEPAEENAPALPERADSVRRVRGIL